MNQQRLLSLLSIKHIRPIHTVLTNTSLKSVDDLLQSLRTRRKGRGENTSSSSRNTRERDIFFECKIHTDGVSAGIFLARQKIEEELTAEKDYDEEVEDYDAEQQQQRRIRRNENEEEKIPPVASWKYLMLTEASLSWADRVIAVDPGRKPIFTAVIHEKTDACYPVGQNNITRHKVIS